MASAALPDTETLRLRLATLLEGRSPHEGEEIRLERLPHRYYSTFPTEIVRYSSDGGAERMLFLKYGIDVGHSHGHRGGIAHEAAVYRLLLWWLPVSTPKFYGTFTYGDLDQPCLVLEYLDGCLRLGQSPQGAMGMAAEWLARFHATAEQQVAMRPVSLLRAYDADYFQGWALRTSSYASVFKGEHPWLAELCRRFEAVLPVLLGGHISVIHGEYYPMNILIHEGAVYPVDWQSAAIGRGEIDLASLTERWEPDVAREAEETYRRSRWPAGAPADFDEALGVARVYWLLRWLGDSPERAARESNGWRVERLRKVGEEVGLL